MPNEKSNATNDHCISPDGVDDECEKLRGHRDDATSNTMLTNHAGRKVRRLAQGGRKATAMQAMPTITCKTPPTLWKAVLPNNNAPNK